MKKKRHKKHSTIKYREYSQPITKIEKIHAWIITIITMISINWNLISAVFIKNSNCLQEFVKAQASLRGLGLSILTVLGISIIKFNKAPFIHKTAYWLTLSLYILIFIIFAQATVTMDPNTNLIIHFLETSYMAILLQIMLIICIVQLLQQQQKQYSIRYKKERIVS